MSDTRSIADRLASARPRDDGIERQRLRAELGTRLLAEPSRPPQIGRYVVLRAIGAGAMGVVYAAYDPDLDRTVAIKVLDSTVQRSATDRHRMLSEARALAKLSDPNVVPVYDVGSLDGRVWIAMELVEGRTLRAWSKASARTWSAVAAVMLDAGRGLAEAHAAGIVHRDFKPENVMIGDDGRVRVMDFGLARAVECEDEEPVPTTPSVRADTAAAGTPAYMAPEQLEGRPADVRTDQFAYCVTFRDALGDGARVPSWLDAVVQRGLSPVASDRWPDMASLLRAVDQGRSRARRRRGFAWLGAATIVIGAFAGGRSLVEGQRERACEQRGDAVAEFWDEGARTRLIEGLLATEVPHAEHTARSVVDRFDAQAERWRDARVQACLDHDVRQRWDDDRLERSQWCLDDRRFELAALARTLTDARRDTANRAVFAASRLADVARCRDPRVLDRLPTIPDNHRDAIRALRERMADAIALYAAGEYDEGLPLAHDIVADADALGWLPLTASARVVEASYLRSTAAYDEAETQATTAYFQAIRLPDWDVAADAALVMLAIAAERHDHDEGRSWGRHAEVALEHANESVGLRAGALHLDLGLLYESAGEYAKARAAYERAYAIEVEVYGEEHPAVTVAMLNLASVDFETADYDRAESGLERVIEIRERSLGTDHPDIATALANLATVVQKLNRDEEARALWHRALAIKESSLGADHPGLGTALNNLAIAENRAGNYAEARSLHERALAIREKRFGPDHPSVATSLDNLAEVHERVGDRAKAITLRERALVVRERSLGPQHPDLAYSLDNLGVMYLRDGDLERARPLLERGLAIRESALGPDHPDVAISLTNLAALEKDTLRIVAIYRRVLAIREAALGPEHTDVARALTNLALELGVEHAESRGLLERAVAIFDARAGVQPREAIARFALARALVITGGDATRARALAEEALRAYRDADDAEEVAKIERWLARHSAG